MADNLEKIIKEIQIKFIRNSIQFWAMANNLKSNYIEQSRRRQYHDVSIFVFIFHLNML